MYISNNKKWNYFCSCSRLVFFSFCSWYHSLSIPSAVSMCPILSIRQIKHKLMQYMARDYLLWFPANTGLTRRQGRIHQSTNVCSALQIEACNEIEDWLQHRSLWWGVIKPLFPCFLLWYLNPRGCGCNSFLLRVTNGWLWSPEEEGALSQRQERTGDLYRGVGTRGRILGNFTALGASPSAPGGSNRGS